MERIEKELMDSWRFHFENEPETEVDLPHDWVNGAAFVKRREDASQGFRVKRGTGWYKRDVELAVTEGHHYFLDFGGVYEQSTVFVNGKEAGGHRYGYTPFRLDVTSLVRSGVNEVEVRVDANVTPTDRWYTGAGIYRTVKLIETGSACLDEREVTVHTRFLGENFEKAEVTVKTGLSAEAGADAAVSGTLVLDGQEWSTEGRKSLSFILENPKLWSAECPQLYTLRLSLSENGKVQDTAVLRIGLRELRFLSGKGMFVNGEPVKLRGVCLHQDMGCMGAAAKKELWRERLRTLKEMGCNAIRAAHHMHSAEFMDLCDELGFYVYEEAFDKWTGGHYAGYFETEWQKDLEAMVKRDRNRPSVVIWGVGNEVENQGQASMLKILKMLVTRVKELDCERPVTYAMNPHFKRESKVDLSTIRDIQQFVDEADDTEIWDVEEKIERIRAIGEFVDIISCNYQEQWYERIHEAIQDKLILGTEIYQYFKGHYHQFKNFTQDNPSLVPERYDYCIGGMIWTGFDYLGESMGYPSKGWNGAMIRTNCVRKPSFYILQSYWSSKPMVHFSVMDYSLADEGVKDHWDVPMYADHWQFTQFDNAAVPYMIASNCEEVELYVNGARMYIPKPAECANRLITGFVSWAPGRVTVIGKNGGEEVCRQELVTPGPAVRLCFEKETVHVRAQRNFQLLFTVRAADAEGNPYFRESAKIRFRAEGPARILAVDNGDAKSHESYEESFIHMYHGCASVVIGLTGEQGRIALYADAEGMQSAELVICAE